MSALLLHTGQDPSQLYDETLARWTLDSLDPEVQHWLAPLLEDQPARRVQRASDALQLLDQPAAFSPAGSSASAASPLDAQAAPSPASLPPLGVDPVPLISKAVFRTADTDTQTRLSREDRLRNMRKAFQVRDASLIRECRLLLVDDVLTTGATASACAESLFLAGARDVRVWTVARGV